MWVLYIPSWMNCISLVKQTCNYKNGKMRQSICKTVNRRVNPKVWCLHAKYDTGIIQFPWKCKWSGNLRQPHISYNKLYQHVCSENSKMWLQPPNMIWSAYRKICEVSSLSGWLKCSWAHGNDSTKSQQSAAQYLNKNSHTV